MTFIDDRYFEEMLTSVPTTVVTASTQTDPGDGPSLQSYITVVVAEDTSDPDNPQTDFTITWSDVDACSTGYDAYFSNSLDVAGGGETTHLGSATTDGSQIASSLSNVEGEGIVFRVKLYCGTEDSGRLVSSVMIPHDDGPSSEESNRRLVPSTYSSEPPLTALTVSPGTLTPTFHSHTPSYTVEDVVSDKVRLTLVATAKPGYGVVFVKDIIGGTISCSPWSLSCQGWNYQDGNGNRVYPLTDAAPNAQGFQVDLAVGGKLSMHVIREYGGKPLENEFYRLTVTRAPNSPATGQPSISGTAQVGETLTVDTSGIDDADGLANVSFSYQWLANGADIAGATSSTYTLVDDDAGLTIKLKVSFFDDKNNQEALTSEATATVVTPLTAEFQDAPDKHDGTGFFTFDIAFSEPISISYKTLRDDSLEVTNGSATKAKRVDGQSDLWKITVEPDSDAAVTVVLPITEDCAAQDAVCTRDGTELSNRSELTVPGPAAANSPATGAPIISGTAQVGETLTVDTSGIDDADGIGNATFSYQWIAGTTDITGATGSTYTLVADDVGKAIRVRVSFDDDRNFLETLTSEPTATVVTPLTAGFRDAPDKHLGTGVFTFEIAFSEPISIGYVTLRDDSLEVTNGSATKAKRVDGQSDLWKITVKPDSDAAVTVVLPITEDCGSDGAVCTRDGTKLSNRSELTVPGPAAANSPATGAPIISGTAQVGKTLTVDTSGIDDADGMSGAVFSYQWLADGADIAGATSDTYTLVEADLDKAVKVRVIFNDDDNNEETLTSAATAAVAAEAAAPDAPRSLNVSPDDTGTLDVSWEAPASDGDSAITGYKVQWKSGSEDYDGSAGSTRQAEITDPASRTHTITGLTDGVEYAVRVIAVNDAGDGPPSDEATGTPGETTPPELSTATVDGATLTLTYDEALDENSEPSSDAFSVAVGGTGRAVDGVSVAGSSVILTLGSAVASGVTVTVSYTAPTDAAAPRIQDEAGNPAASFSDQDVENNTPPPANTPATGAPTISGTVRVGETLTASTSAIADADGMSGAVFSYQWLANGADIAGATSDSYTPVAADQGKTIKVKVSFRDDKNNPETLTSAATAAVAAETAAPDAPQSLNVSPDDTGTLDVSWEAPASDGDSAITGYKVQWKSGSEDYDGSAGSTRQAEITDPASRTHSITGLTDGVEYTVRVIAVNDAGDGPPSVEATATPLSREARLRQFVETGVVQEYGADHPWLREVWAYMSEPGFDLVVLDHPAHQGEVAITCAESPVSGLEGCEARELQIDVDYLEDEGVIIHEMAHIYTLANDIASKPAPLGIAHLYFDSLGLGVNRFSECRAHDLYADVMTIGVLGHVELVHWGTCNGTNDNGIDDTLTQQVLALVGSALDGEMPQWFADAYNGADGDPDLERVWADLKAVEVDEEDILDHRIPVVYQLRDAFGGYCNSEIAGLSIFNDGETRNPWQDGGCVPEEPGNLTVTAGDTEVSLSWETPGYDGGSPLEGYRVQWKSGSEEYDDTPTSTRQAEVTDLANLAHTIAGLTNGVEYTVRVLAYNHNGVGAVSTEVTVTPEAPNSPATGAPTISGTVRVGETLTADTSDIADADGMSGAVFSYQWLANGVEVVGATGSSYTPVADDVGKAIKVRVSFRDDRNHQESLTSAATAAADDSSIWSATLTVGESWGFVGFWKGVCGALDPDEFRLDGNDYPISMFAELSGRYFQFRLDQALPVAFTLRVGETTFESKDAEQLGGSSSGVYQWTGQLAGLTEGSTVEVSLTLAE